MAIEAPITKYKTNNLKIYIAVCLIFAVVFAYDGYLSKYDWSHRRSFYEDNVIDNKPNDTMMFNRISPIFLVVLAAVLAVRLRAVKDKKLLADENELILDNKGKIPYDSIQKIDKTHFESKGFFLITYKNEQGNEINHKLSNRQYDNLTALLDEIVTKIS